MAGEIILLLAVILLLTVVCVIVGVLLNRQGEKIAVPPVAEGRYGRHWWQVQLVDLQTGKRIGKSFQSRLILGRTVAAQEPLRLLFVGGQQTISRSQCEIVERKGGLVIHNLSGVNMTWHNGTPLNQTQQLNRGDWLDMGGSRYILERLDRVV